jgi:hypothetical protein
MWLFEDLVSHRPTALAIAIALGALGVPPRAAMAQDLINADRPSIADGSKVIAPGQFQIETGIQHETRRDVQTMFVPTLARVGVGARVELRIEGNTLSYEAGVTGFAPISIGAKVALIDLDRGPTVGVIVRGFPASGSNDFKTDHFTGDARLAADIPLGGKVSLNPNVGAARYDEGGLTYGAGVFALSLNYQLSERLNPFIDVGYQSSTGHDTSGSVTIDTGIGWIIGSDLQVDFSVGQGVNGASPRPFIAGGISVRFGRHGQPVSH